MPQKPLTPEEIEGYRAILLALLSNLRSSVTEMADKALQKNSGELSTVPLHMADVGTDNFEQEFTLSLAESGSQALFLIKAAIERIDDGTFGACEECDAPISRARLNAIPFAHLCINCASEQERNRF